MIRCELKMPDRDIQTRDTVSTILAYVLQDRPSPPYSVWMIEPNRPSSLILATISSGQVSLCSSSMACGTTSRSRNCSTLARISFSSSLEVCIAVLPVTSVMALKIVALHATIFGS